MNCHELAPLLITAASLGFIHTLIGPDHYVPFIAMARAGHWSSRKVFVVTLLSGLGHVGSSVVLGALGAWLGVAVLRIEVIEATRGEWAGWALLAFGLCYFVWGLRRALRSRPHEHPHRHEGGDAHAHFHAHHGDHSHPHPGSRWGVFGPWAIFLIFVFGPCEPLIPVLMYPAVRFGAGPAALVALVFSLATIVTMLGAVFLSMAGLQFLPAPRLERYSHALAGASILFCGVAIRMGM